MILKMYIYGFLIAKYQLDYTDMDTVSERQQYQEKVAVALYWEHYKKILTAQQEPVFYIDNVPSKMNDMAKLNSEQIL